MKNLIITTILVALSLVNFSQTLPNAEFQSWIDNGFYEEPEFWNTPNPALLLLGSYTVLKSDIAFSGDYSAMLETKSFFGSIVIPGVITLAQINIDPSSQQYTIDGGLALHENVSKLTGMYQYSGANGDSASVLIYNFKRNDDGIMDTIGYGFGYLKDAVSWTSFTVNMVNLNNHVPDTFNVIIVSSGVEFQAGSVLLVDSLAIETNTGIINLGDELVSVKIYPNPSSEFVTFETYNFEKDRLISVYNAVGSLVGIKYFSEKSTKMSVVDFPSGIYTFRITKDSRLLSRGSFLKE